MKEKLFEMPQIMAGEVDWGLGEPTKNLARAEKILSLPHEIIPTNYSRGTLYLSDHGRNGGEYSFISNDSGKILYYMSYKTSNPANLGNAATQVKLWASAAPPGLTSFVFFKQMLARFDTMVSDRIQTDDGKRFWYIRLFDATEIGLQIGLIKGTTIHFYDKSEGYESWIEKSDGWGKADTYQEHRYFISKIHHSKI